MKLRSVNHAFLRTLYRLYGRSAPFTFTTQNAEHAYANFHWSGYLGFPKGKYPERMNGWGRMSARNTLVAATQHGFLRRISKGLYTFNNTTKGKPNEKRNASV